MYRKWKGGSKKHIQGIDVNFPPVGQAYNPYTDQLEKVGILKRSQIKKEQYWQRIPEPEDYKERLKAERETQETTPDYYDSTLQAYRNDMWEKREKGVWFMNNGEPFYITGLHFFYLNFWKIDVGYPQFRVPDAEFFWFLEYCCQDPRCLGMIEATKRRQGKTKRAGVFLYDRVTKNANYSGGIQSKTLEDAKKNVFQKGIIQPFKYLPDFFVPTYDTSKGVTPENELRFYAPTKRTSKAAQTSRSSVDELESEITFKSAELFAYDGTKQQGYVADEVGKTKDTDVYERHQVVRFCLELDGEIIGKCLYTTTVEDMESGGEAFQRLWNGSNPSKRNDNGRTTTGLYKYFLPAYRTLYYDKFGYPDEAKAKEFYYNERKALEDDPKALAGYIRKNPFSEEEMFWVDGEKCLFDAIKINNQLDAVSWLDEDEILIRGDFLWENNVKDTNVEFYPHARGKFLLHKDLVLTGRWNNVETRGTLKLPKNKVKFVAGVDPFDHNITVDSRRSNGAAYIYAKYDATSALSETFVCQYIHRPPTAEIFYEDMVKMCHFFGCEVLIEDNKIGLVKYFEARGYVNFLMRLPQQKKVGISATKKSHQQLVEELELYVHECVENIRYKDLLQDLLKFDINNTTKHDASMAAGWTLVGAGKHKLKTLQAKPQHVYDYNDIFPRYR